MDENGLKLLLEYDVNQDTLQEYYQFIMGCLLYTSRCV